MSNSAFTPVTNSTVFNPTLFLSPVSLRKDQKDKTSHFQTPNIVLNTRFSIFPNKNEVPNRSRCTSNVFTNDEEEPKISKDLPAEIKKAEEGQSGRWTNEEHKRFLEGSL